MDVLVVVVECILALIVGGFIVSKYLDIKNERTRKIFNVVLSIFAIVLVIALVICFIYFFNVISNLRSV
jgi:phosphotransferase system  glucose/maltose/N-acetylglucosamine-specific IIC component